jgi:hypothetical protein
MRMDYLTESFVVAVLTEALERNRMGGPARKELADIVGGAVQICIDADRAVKIYLNNPACSCRNQQGQSQGL